MKIAGLQKLTLLDYPGKTACTVFTPGCDFRCPFCHNADLVVGTADDGAFPFLPENDFFAFLDKRHGLLDGVCVTGGEPTLQPGLADFLARVRAEGFAVKLDTNGSRPTVLRALLDAGLLDAVAMDVKNAPARYAETAGAAASAEPTDGTACPDDAFDLESVEESMRTLLAGDVPFEFRTTVVDGLHTAESLEEAARWIARLAVETGADPASVRWFLQNFEDAESVIAGAGSFAPWPKERLKALLPRLQGILPQTALRGIS